MEHVFLKRKALVYIATHNIRKMVTQFTVSKLKIKIVDHTSV